MFARIAQKFKFSNGELGGSYSSNNSAIKVIEDHSSDMKPGKNPFLPGGSPTRYGRSSDEELKQRAYNAGRFEDHASKAFRSDKKDAPNSYQFSSQKSSSAMKAPSNSEYQVKVSAPEENGSQYKHRQPVFDENVSPNIRNEQINEVTEEQNKT